METSNSSVGSVGGASAVVSAAEVMPEIGEKVPGTEMVTTEIAQTELVAEKKEVSETDKPVMTKAQARALALVMVTELHGYDFVSEPGITHSSFKERLSADRLAENARSKMEGGISLLMRGKREEAWATLFWVYQMEARAQAKRDGYALRHVTLDPDGSAPQGQKWGHRVAYVAASKFPQAAPKVDEASAPIESSMKEEAAKIASERGASVEIAPNKNELALEAREVSALELALEAQRENRLPETLVGEEETKVANQYNEGLISIEEATAGIVLLRAQAELAELPQDASAEMPAELAFDEEDAHVLAPHEADEAMLAEATKTDEAVTETALTETPVEALREVQEVLEAQVGKVEEVLGSLEEAKPETVSELKADEAVTEPAPEAVNESEAVDEEAVEPVRQAANEKGDEGGSRKERRKNRR